MPHSVRSWPDNHNMTSLKTPQIDAHTDRGAVDSLDIPQAALECEAQPLIKPSPSPPKRPVTPHVTECNGPSKPRSIITSSPGAVSLTTPSPTHDRQKERGLQRKFSRLFSKLQGQPTEDTSEPGSPKSRKSLTRKPSSFFHSRSRGRDASDTPPFDSPELKTMLKGGTTLDLKSVNKALEELTTSSTSQDEIAPYITNLTQLVRRMEAEAQDCRKQLSLAMQERDRGHAEICRSICLDIIHNAHSHVETKIYANNILASQASPGMGKFFLDESERLVRSNLHAQPGLEKLLDVIEVLRANVELRLPQSRSNAGSGTVEKTKKDSLVDDQLTESTGKEGLKLKIPLPFSRGIGDGACTPKTKQIIQWSAINEAF